MVFSFTQKANATHAAGADLTYRCLGGLVYEIEATFYRDCGGSSEPGNVTISYKSATCGFARSVLANKVLVNNGMEITLPCVTAPSTCNGGVSTGVRKWVYRTTVTLPSACTDWVFSYRVCCRNCTITTIQSPCATNSEIYVEAKLNNLAAPGNSSPEFNNMPVAFVCLGQNFNYNQGVSDVDGDSLAYELITPKTSATTEVAWLAPASTQSPLASSSPFTINALTGDINFTPSSMQIGILAIRVNEFRNGQLIGSTIRDMQVYTQNCFNSIPVATGINGTSSYSANTCAGQQVCFTVSAQDVDSTQHISFSVYNPIPGSVITQTAGSLPSIQFCWTPTEAQISRLPYIFTLTIYDDACPVNGVQTFSYSVFVQGPQATFTTHNPDCGINNGSAAVNVNNEPNCTYLWNTVPPRTTQTISGLAPGNFEVTVTDQHGCTGLFDVTLNAPVNTVGVTCTSSGVISCQSGNIGAAQVVVNSGVSPFSYVWNTGATTSSINGLGAGTYYVTVTDANGCADTDSVVIASAPGNVSAQASMTNAISCFGGNNGAATCIASGGIAPYTYSWSNGATTQQTNGLTAGNYSVTATDVNGCSTTSTVSISQPQAGISTSFVSSGVSCFGGNNGSLNVFVNGGTLPYTYNWSNGSSAQTATGLSAGNYSVTVTDFKGCSGIFSASVTQPSAVLNIGIATLQPVHCFGSDDGSLEIMVSGGAAPYTYSWNHGANTSAIQNLEAGIYSVTVTDANGCTNVFSATITQPAAPVLGLTTVTSNISCYGASTGSLSLTVNGGNTPYSFQWSNGTSSQNLNNIPAGNYQVTITDASGCTTTTNGTVTQPALQLAVNVTTQQILCFNGNNGTLTSVAGGGAGPYSYLWNTGATVPYLAGLTSGTYTVTVTDGNNCTSTTSAIITQPSSPLMPVISSSQPVNCSGQQNGVLSLQVSGGTTPYTFLWSNGSTTQNNSNLATGIYTVTITDANGCNAIISDSISGSASTITALITVSNGVTCSGGSNGVLVATPSGGTAPYTYIWNTGVQTSAISGVNAGNYSVTITDANGCTANSTAAISQPASAMQITANVTGANCLNGAAGAISLNTTGGTAGYTYLWSNGSTSQNLVNLATGNYSVTITDANGCTTSGSYIISGEVEFAITASGPTIICSGQTITLSADSVANGAYQWYYDGDELSGATGMQFITPAAGIYYVEVTNSCGTFASAEIEVEVKSFGNVSVSNAQIICPPETAQLFASGGSTYEWTPNSYITFTTVADPFVSPMTTTIYSVQIANEWGCKTSLSTTVAVVCDTLLVPTGFSPNSDGVNDGYVIDGIENYPGNKLWVYNRWGKLVYKATDYNNSWDGIGNISGISVGQKVLSGTYYYILDLHDGSKPKAGYLIIRH